MIICPRFCLLLRQHWMLMRLTIHQASSSPTTTSDDELCKWVKRKHTHTPYGLNYISQTLTQLVCIDFWFLGWFKNIAVTPTFIFLNYSGTRFLVFRCSWYKKRQEHESLPDDDPGLQDPTRDFKATDLHATPKGRKWWALQLMHEESPLLALNEGLKKLEKSRPMIYFYPHCWWFRNPVNSPVELGSSSHYLQVFFYIPGG